jgi:hypothetical protein
MDAAELNIDAASPKLKRPLNFHAPDVNLSGLCRTGHLADSLPTTYQIYFREQLPGPGTGVFLQIQYVA